MEPVRVCLREALNPGLESHKSADHKHRSQNPPLGDVHLVSQPIETIEQIIQAICQESANVFHVEVRPREKCSYLIILGCASKSAGKRA